MTVTLDSRDVTIVHRGLKMDLATVLDKLEQLEEGSKESEDTIKDAIMEEVDDKLDSCAKTLEDADSKNSDSITGVSERLEKVEKLLEGI